MPPHPLDGARLKVVRAKEHLDAFNEMSFRYLKTEPYKIVPELGPEVIRIDCIVTAEPPPALAYIVGDFVTNIRAALDYIAWELFSKFGPTDWKEGQQRRIIFPIIPSKPDFTKVDGSTKLLREANIPAPALDVIESVQPYHAGYESLKSLNLLVNRDKHRTLLLCASFVESAGNFSVYHRGKLAWTVSGMTEMSMNLAAFSPSLVGSTDFKMTVEGKPTVLIAIKDFPVPPKLVWVGILEQILKCVTNIVPRFDQFFL